MDFNSYLLFKNHEHDFGSAIHIFLDIYVDEQENEQLEGFACDTDSGRTHHFNSIYDICDFLLGADIEKRGIECEYAFFDGFCKYLITSMHDYVDDVSLESEKAEDLTNAYRLCLQLFKNYLSVNVVDRAWCRFFSGCF